MPYYIGAHLFIYANISVQRRSEETGQFAGIVFNSSNKVAQLSDQLKIAVAQFLMGIQSQSEDDKEPTSK